MLKWNEVKYELNGLKCTVIFDSPGHPRDFRKYTGIIEVADIPDAIPLLHNPFNQMIMSPPWYATVIVHPPVDREYW